VSGDDTGPGDELDLLKVFVWLMLVMTVALAVVWFVVKTKREDAEQLFQSGKRQMAQLAEEKGDIQAMLKVYETNSEDLARNEPLSWFSKIWQSKGITRENIQLGVWRDPPEY
jgi:hypothetical protein